MGLAYALGLWRPPLLVLVALPPTVCLFQRSLLGEYPRIVGVRPGRGTPFIDPPLDDGPWEPVDCFITADRVAVLL